jgi:hypothetical protein
LEAAPWSFFVPLTILFEGDDTIVDVSDYSSDALRKSRSGRTILNRGTSTFFEDAWNLHIAAF